MNLLKWKDVTEKNRRQMIVRLQIIRDYSCKTIMQSRVYVF